MTSAPEPALPIVPALTYEAAVTRLAQAGSPYATTPVRVGELELTGFAHAPRSLRELYENAVTHYAAREFMIYEAERLTFAVAVQRMQVLAHALQRLGIRKGDRVAIAMRNYPEFCVAFGAITALGAIAVTLNSWWHGEELHYGLSDSGARFGFVDQERLERLAGLSDVLPLGVAVARPTGNALPQGVLDMASLTTGSETSFPVLDAELGADDDAILMYTSGSTAHPKGVVSSHRAILSALLCWESARLAAMLSGEDPLLRNAVTTWLQSGVALGRPLFTFSPQRALLLNLPLFHVTGLHTMLLASFRTGRKVVFMYKWSAERALELIEQERITDVHGVPTMTWEIINSPDFGKRDISSLETMGAGGAARPPEHVRQIKQKAAKAVPGIGYGLTETNALGTVISGADYEARPSSVGRPLPPIVKIEIRDDAGKALPVGSEGEICILSVTNMRGYWNQPKATAEALRAGWLHTGDIGRMDAEGFVYITDRAKDVVIRGGENISCTEVESALFEHKAVYEAAVHGLPDERLGEVLCATVMLRPAHTATADELKAHVAARLASFKVPTHILFTTEQLPRGATGKIDKRALKKSAAERILGQAS
jgi:long-chain acyl-CoA synthetase